MGLDSVELILAWEESFGISITEAEAKTMFTTRQVTELIYRKVKSSDLPEDHGCLSMRAFFRLRKELAAANQSGLVVKPDSKLAELLPGRRRRDMLNAVLSRAGFRPQEKLPFGLQFTFGRVRDVVLDAVICQHQSLRLPGHGWSKAQVREVVRGVTATQLALKRFSDDAEFVKDLGMD
jgi:hypothetical protein